jgi:hypothetical protein
VKIEMEANGNVAIVKMLAGKKVVLRKTTNGMGLQLD